MKKISKSLLLALCVSALPQAAVAQSRGQAQGNGQDRGRPAAETPATNETKPTREVKPPEPAPAPRREPVIDRRTPQREPVVDRRGPAAQRAEPAAQGRAGGEDARAQNAREGQTEQRVQNAREQQREERIHNAREQQRQEEERTQNAREQQRREEQRIQNARGQQRQEEQRGQNARGNAGRGAGQDDVTGQPPEVVFRKFKLEEGKHRDRVARIAALRRLANARQNEQQVAELDRLLERENARYGEWIRRTRSALGPEEFEAQRARLDGRAIRRPERGNQRRAPEPVPEKRPQ